MDKRKKIIYIQHTDPAAYPPLEHSAKIFERNGYEILFLGVYNKTDGKFSPSRLKFPEQLASSCIFFPERAKRRFSTKIHYLLFILWCIYICFRRSPDLIYASDTGACPPALFLRLLGRYRTVYHEHDSPTEGVQPKNLSIRCILTARKLLLRFADMTIMPNLDRIKQAERCHTIRSYRCVYNCPSLDEIARDSDLGQSGKDLFWIAYQGSIVAERLPMSLLTALAELPESVCLRIIGYDPSPHSRYISEFLGKAEQLGLSRRIDSAGAVPHRSAMLEMVRSSSLGLCFMPRTSPDINMQRMLGASNKPFDYLSQGVPLLVSDLDEWRRFYVDPGFGFACNPDDPEDIAKVVSACVDRRDLLRSMGLRGRDKIIAEWNYEKQFEEALRLIS